MDREINTLIQTVATRLNQNSVQGPVTLWSARDQAHIECNSARADAKGTPKIRLLASCSSGSWHHRCLVPSRPRGRPISKAGLLAGIVVCAGPGAISYLHEQCLPEQLS